MIVIVKDWFNRQFSSPETVALLFTFIFFTLLFWLMGKILAPVFVSIVIAYLLDSIVDQFEKWRSPHLLSVICVSLIFVGSILIILFWLLPLIWAQLVAFINEVPHMINRGQLLLNTLSTHYPDLISVEQFKHYVTEFSGDLSRMGRAAVSYSLASIPSVIELLVYAILVPLMVFFFLKDRDEILSWLTRFVPKRRGLLDKVWHEVDRQMGNYVRAKVLEVLIIALVSTLAFVFLGLNYSLLLGVLVGLSVIIPFVGVIVVTLPVLIVGFIQWGFSAHFIYLLVVYTVITVLDGNLLAPLLFSETMAIHPIAVIVAVLVFGGLWGFWGVFFAIPLATLVKAVINAWPQAHAND